MTSRPARFNAAALSRLIVWVEPVLPQTSNPSTRAPFPVPPSLADFHMPAMTLSNSEGLNCGSSPAAVPALPSAGAPSARSRWGGAIFRPRRATRAVMTATWSGVTWSWP